MTLTIALLNEDRSDGGKKRTRFYLSRILENENQPTVAGSTSAGVWSWGWRRGSKKLLGYKVHEGCLHRNINSTSPHTCSLLKIWLKNGAQRPLRLLCVEAQWVKPLTGMPAFHS